MCANNFGTVCTNCAPCPLEISRKHAERVCANCFWKLFFGVGRLPLIMGIPWIIRLGETQRTLPYKKDYDDSKNSELLRRSVFTTPPQFTTPWTFFERNNGCNSQANGVRTRCAAIVNHPTVLKRLRVVNLLRVVFLVRRGSLGDIAFVGVYFCRHFHVHSCQHCLELFVGEFMG